MQINTQQIKQNEWEKITKKLCFSYIECNTPTVNKDKTTKINSNYHISTVYCQFNQNNTSFLPSYKNIEFINYFFTLVDKLCNKNKVNYLITPEYAFILYSFDNQTQHIKKIEKLLNISLEINNLFLKILYEKNLNFFDEGTSNLKFTVAEESKRLATYSIKNELSSFFPSLLNDINDVLNNLQNNLIFAKENNIFGLISEVSNVSLPRISKLNLISLLVTNKLTSNNTDKKLYYGILLGSNVKIFDKNIQHANNLNTKLIASIEDNNFKQAEVFLNALVNMNILPPALFKKYTALLNTKANNNLMFYKAS